MKSRLLSSATALVLLLGLASTSLFGQITNTGSIEFMIRAYDSGENLLPGLGPWGYQLATADNALAQPADTVGHKMDVAVRWDAPSQFLTQVTYTITLPVGTTVEDAVKDAVTIVYKDVDLTEVHYAVPSSSVAVNGNTVTVTDVNTFSSTKTVTVLLEDGIYLGGVLSEVNSETGGKMKFSFEHGASAGTVVSDITSFYAVNDLADGVQLNEDVTAYIDEIKYWPNVDSLVIVDRFGNYVPDFLTASNLDSLIISVAEGAGQFADSSENAGAPTAGSLKPVTGGTVYMSYNDDSTAVKLNGGVVAYDAVGGDDNTIYHKNAASDAIVIHLGAIGSSEGALGLTFNAPEGAESTTFTFTLLGNVASGTLLGVEASSGTLLGVEASGVTEVARDVLPAEAAKEIGSLAVEDLGPGNVINAQEYASDFKITLKNRFGEAFDGDIGDACDSLLITFAYWDATYDADADEWSWAFNSTLTDMLNSGGPVTSKYSRPATELVHSNVEEGVITGITLTNGVGLLDTPEYWGTASHPYGDSIAVIIMAFNDHSKSDTVMLKVEPSVPVAFDLDTLKANLAIANAEGHIVEGMPIAIDLPICINILIDGRDPVGYQSQTVQDSISFVTVGDERTVDQDSSYIYALDIERTDSSRINLGGVGPDSLGLRLNYPAGINYKISVRWDPGQLGSLGAGDYAARSLDLGLFNITGLATTDSVRNVAVASPATITVDDTVDLVVQFTLPKDPQNTIGPNRDEKNIQLSIAGMPAGSGIPAGIVKESVEISADQGANYYASLDVTQDAEDNNVLEIQTPIELNATLADQVVYVKIMDFAAPSEVDTFAITITTDATPVSATNEKAIGLAPSGPAPGDPSEFDFVDVPDSLNPLAATEADSINIDVSDPDGLAKVYLNIYESTLTLSETTNMFEESDAVVTTDSLVYSGTLPTSAQIRKEVAAKALGTKIAYDVMAIDASDDTVSSAMGMYIVAPLRGKRNMETTAVNIADVMRLVYLVAGVVPADAIKVEDWFGLDLNANGSHLDDLEAELALWRGTGTLLASAAGELASDAKVALSYEAVDKTNANLMVELENNGILNMGVFRIKYDTEKYVLGDAVAADRLKDLTVVSYNNEAEGEYRVVVVNVNGRPIVSGSGAIVTIPVSAVGEKFDGVGDISLLDAVLEESVQVELDQAALALKVQLPKAFALSQNYPNPFNPSTTIAFDIPEGKEANVRLNVYNMRGQLIRTLVDEVKSEGSYQIQWDGTDNYGRRVSSGVYFYRITTGEFSQTRKMVILK